jgi:hypothetical protein
LARQIAPPACPDIAASKEGFLKVRLTYLTHDPKHIQNFLLRNGYGIQGPYSEDICILMPANRVFENLETYLPAFELLQKSGVVRTEDTFLDFRILVEDDLTLAHVIN